MWLLEALLKSKRLFVLLWFYLFVLLFFCLYICQNIASLFVYFLSPSRSSNAHHSSRATHPHHSIISSHIIMFVILILSFLNTNLFYNIWYRYKTSQQENAANHNYGTSTTTTPSFPPHAPPFPAPPYSDPCFLLFLLVPPTLASLWQHRIYQGLPQCH